MMTNDHTAATLQLIRDEQDIRDLGYRFADACNRGDVEEFRSLWARDAVWVIDDPMNVRAEGAAAIAGTLAQLRPMWDFFVQMPHAPVVRVDGDRATSTWTVSEHARHAADGRDYVNHARYDDELARTPEGWRYAHRRYGYYFLDDGPRAGAAAAPVRPGPGIH